MGGWTIFVIYLGGSGVSVQFIDPGALKWKAVDAGRTWKAPDPGRIWKAADPGRTWKALR